MTTLPAYILAGGRSRRFGSDKARLDWNGHPLIRHVGALLEPAAASLTVVADQAGKFQDLGLRTIADRQPGLGPLAGLAAALRDLPASEDWLLLAPCDVVVLRRDWLGRLLAARQAGLDAVAFRQAHWQPMPALYARSAMVTVNRQLATEDRSMQRLLDTLRAVSLPLPADWSDRWQINTPDDLEAHRRGDGDSA